MSASTPVTFDQARRSSRRVLVALAFLSAMLVPIFLAFMTASIVDHWNTRASWRLAFDACLAVALGYQLWRANRFRTDVISMEEKSLALIAELEGLSRDQVRQAYEAGQAHMKAQSVAALQSVGDLVATMSDGHFELEFEGVRIVCLGPSHRSGNTTPNGGGPPPESGGGLPH